MCIVLTHDTAFQYDGCISFLNLAGTLSPRTCMTSLLMPPTRRQLPKWANGMASIQDPALRALSQEWSKQQTLLTQLAQNLQPHQVSKA
jgi:hypothetical protein